MISSVENRIDEFDVSEQTQRFEVDAPKSNPLIPTAAASMRKENDAVAVEWQETPSAALSPTSELLISELVVRAKREVEKFPMSSRAHTRLGLALRNAGRLEEAASVLTSALGLDSTNYIAGATLAQVYSEQGDLERAESIYRNMLAAYPENESLLLSLAYLAMRKGEFRGAEEFLQEAKTSNDRSGVTHFLLGIVRLAIDRPQSAIGALRNAVVREVRNPAYHHALGVAYALAGDAEHAARSLRVALALSPDSPESIHALCSVLARRRELDGAVELLRPYLERHPDDSDARSLLADIFIEQHKYGHARAHLRQVLQSVNLSSDRRAALLNDVGVTLVHEGKTKDAEEELLRAVACNPTSSATPYENLARLRFAKEDLDAAVEILTRATRLFPERQLTHNMLAVAYARLDRWEDGIATLVRFWRGGTADAETYSSLGWLYGWSDLSTALEVLLEGQSRFPRNPVILNNLAYTFLMLGDTDRGRQILEEWPDGVQKRPEFYATSGLLKLCSGDFKAGRALYAEAQLRAKKAGNRELAARIHEKAHLELARYHLRRHDSKSARIEISRGLAERNAKFSCRRELLELKEQLQEGTA